MTANNSRYLSTLHDNMDRYFSLEEIRTLCFDLGVDFDSVRGEGKSARIRELLIAMGRSGRLPELLSLVQQERRNVTWPPIPDDFELPQSLKSDAPAAPTVTNNYYGAVVNAENSNVAVGSQAAVTTNTGDTYNLSGDFRGANLNIKSTLENVAQSVGTLPNSDATAKIDLQQLLVALNNALQTAPDEHASPVEELSESTKILVEESSKEKPNQTMMKMLGNGLREAAESLGTILPAVVTIVDQIITAVSKLHQQQ
jgi:Effector-associated domain 7